ncbi:MAG: gliding motility-associated C-terminal domain-containing protein, partial [Paludibacter sp.]
LGANFYRWNDGTTADSIWIKQAGDYSLIGRTITGCLDTLYFKASYYDTYNYTIQTDRNEVSTDGAPLHIWSEGIPYSHYYWDFGDSISTDQNYDVNHTYTANKAGHYDIKLKVINPNGCTEYATKRIWITNNSEANTFSPNNDGNDFLKGWHVQIYNRNGLLIFEGKDGWPGTYHGKTVSADTYFYVVYYESESGTKSRTGYVTVIR